MFHAYGADESLLRCGSVSNNDSPFECVGEIKAVDERSYLTKAWDLDGNDDELNKKYLSPLRPYRPSYLIVRKSTRPNSLPHSPAPGHATLTPLDLDATELKFQFSTKAQILNSRNIHVYKFNSFRLWGAYTQQSSWQAFNSRNSSPFRETNYEPELIATFGTDNKNGLKLVNLGFAHQSNGKGLPDSRSWNRYYLQGGWETDELSILVRKWWRIPESALKDDNPDIENYVGRAEIAARWEPDDTQTISFILRNNLRMSQNHSFVQIDWATPVSLGKSSRLHIQYTSGYGESLIDYNHHQATLGLGISFRDW